MATSTLEVVIKGRDQLSPAIRSATGSLNNLKTSAGGFGDTILAGVGLGAGIGAFGLFTAAAAKAVDGLGDAVTRALEDEASVKRLTVALTDNIPAWNGNTGAIDAFVKKAEGLAFTDDQARDSLTKLAAVTHDLGRAMDDSRLAMDLARLRGIDLATATDMIAKAEGGNIGALRRVLPFIDANATATEALAAITKAAAGQADAFAETTQGKLVQSQIAYGEALERLGYTVMPAVGTAAGALAQQFEWIDRAINDISLALADLGGMLPPTAEGFDALGLTIENLPLIGAWIRTNKLRDAEDAAAKAALDHADAVSTLKDAMEGSLGTTEASTKANIFFANSAATIGKGAIYAAERVQTLRDAMEGQDVSVKIAKQAGAWDATSAFYAMNRGLEGVSLGLTTVKDKSDAADTSFKGKTRSIRDQTAAIVADTAATGTASATLGKVEMSVTSLTGSYRHLSEAVSDAARRSTTAYHEMGVLSGGKTPPLVKGPKGGYAMTPEGGYGAPGNGPAVSVDTALPGTGTHGATGVMTGAAEVPIVIALDGRVIAEVVNTHLARMAKL